MYRIDRETVLGLLMKFLPEKLQNLTQKSVMKIMTLLFINWNLQEIGSETHELLFDTWTNGIDGVLKVFVYKSKTCKT